jgi:hypothetical protein
MKKKRFSVEQIIGVLKGSGANRCRWIEWFCDRGLTMGRLRNIEAMFAGRHFDREVILLCVRWYLRYKLSFRDLVEMMAERGLPLAHTTILRWVRRIRQSSSSGGIALAAALAARGESMKSISRYTESGPICIGQ